MVRARGLRGLSGELKNPALSLWLDSSVPRGLVHPNEDEVSSFLLQCSFGNVKSA